MESQEVSIGKLQEAVKNLGEREQEHHQIVLSEIRDLKDGVVVRLDRVEARIEVLAATKLLASDFINFKEREFVTVSTELERLKIWKTRMTAYASVIALLSGIAGNILYNVIANLISNHLH